MIEGMDNGKRLEAIQNLLTRIEYTENAIKPLVVGDGEVQIDSNAVANMILHTVLNQMTIMNTLKDMLLKKGETAVRVQDDPKQEQEQTR